MRVLQLWIDGVSTGSATGRLTVPAQKNLNNDKFDFISACEVINGGKTVMLQAISSSFKDKEDALQYYSALNHGADYFLTRNISDYKHVSERLPVMTPAEFVESLN